MNKTKCSFEGCSGRVFLHNLKCRCGEKFCDKHRLPETHDCSFNFKEDHANKSHKIIEEMKCIGSKLEII